MKKPCRQPGCNALVDSGYCERHSGKEQRPKREYDQRRKKDPALALAARIRSSPRWSKTRRIKLGLNPLCEDPIGLHRSDTETATQVHHIKGLATHPDLAYNLDNLMSVCTPCHARIEADVRSEERQ